MALEPNQSKLSYDDCRWLVEQIEPAQWRTFSVLLPDVSGVLDDLRRGRYSYDRPTETDGS
jgi:hypothetical protein